MLDWQELTIPAAEVENHQIWRVVPLRTPIVVVVMLVVALLAAMYLYLGPAFVVLAVPSALALTYPKQ